MPKYVCLLPDCPSNSFDPPKALSFFRFPSCEDLRQEWREVLNLEDSGFDYNSAWVCSLHFSGSDFVKNCFGDPVKTRLKDGAIPHQNFVAIKKEIEDDGYEDRGPLVMNVMTVPQMMRQQDLDNTHFQSVSTEENSLGAESVPLEPLENPNVVAMAQASSSVAENINYIPSSVPSTQDWPGKYEFTVSFGPQEKNTKGISWTYSKIKNKLFVNKLVPCPINFSSNSLHSDDVQIRIMALYCSPEHAPLVVERCNNHKMRDLMDGVREASHLVRCEGSMVNYEVHPVSKHHSVVLPFENPPAGQLFSTFIFKFGCFSSCEGGPTRRPMTLVFSLEKGGEVVGRRKIELKVCACPGRDRSNEEKCEEKERVLEPKPLKRKKPDLADLNELFNFTNSFQPTTPYKKPKKDANGYFTIAVNDQEQYEFLRQMNKLYKICTLMQRLSPEDQRVLLNKERKDGDDSS